MEALVFICGAYSVAFALFHLLFWRLFHWKTALKKMSAVNSAITQILNLRIIYFFLFVAFICFRFPAELLNTDLGRAFLIGIALFWLGRTAEQFVFFRLNDWRVNLLTVIFLLGAALFSIPVLL
jgi:hypothetical protein